MVKNNDTTNKITIYRLRNRIDLTTTQIDGYTKVAEGAETSTNFNYTLWFGDNGLNPPKWYFPFSRITTVRPTAKQAGFVLLINSQNSSYACTGGLGFHKLQEHLMIEPRFGILIARKILAATNIRGLSQKDASGIVHNLDRVFRGTYNPAGDIDNLHRILTSLRASFSKGSDKYKKLGSSIKASDSLTVNKTRDFAGICEFVKEVDDLWSSDIPGLTIPELENINPKFEPDLIIRLNQTLAKTIRDYGNTNSDISDRLFLDNVDIGYLPDYVSEYTLCKNYTPKICSSHEDVFRYLAKRLADYTGPEDELYKELESIRVKMRFDDGFENTYKPISHYICGDIELDNEAYFISNCLWFRANTDFIAKINAELDEMHYLPPGDLALQSWNKGENEDSYNKRHVVKNCILLDKRFVHVEQEKGPIEFCDLLFIKPNAVNVIHVKHACGAELRALFAQGYVSAMLYAESEEFKTKVLAAEVDKKSELCANDISDLAGLSSRPKREFCIVYAIYDENPAHDADSTAPSSVSKVLGKTLTLFAKIDLLGRAQAIRAMGFNVALTRIQPYP